MEPDAVVTDAATVGACGNISFSTGSFMSMAATSVPLGGRYSPTERQVSRVTSVIPSRSIPSSGGVTVVIPISRLGTSWAFINDVLFNVLVSTVRSCRVASFA